MSGRQEQPVQRDRDKGSRTNATGKRGAYSRAWADPNTKAKKYLKPPAYTSLDEVPEGIQMRGFKKLAWIQRFVNEDCPRGKLEEYARAHAEAQDIPASEVPKYTTLNTWVYQHRQFGLLGLMDAVRKPHPRSLSEDMKTALETIRFGGGKHSPAAVLDELVKLYGDSPSYATLRREVRRLERRHPHLKTLVDEGIPGFQSKLRYALSGARQPGGVVVGVDSTGADIWIRVPDRNAPDGWKAQRVVLTVVVDQGSRAILTFNLSLRAIDAGIMLSTFRRALVQSANYPGLVSLKAPPRRVVADKGAEHHRKFREEMERLQVDLTYGPPNTPETNPRTERVIGTITSEVFKPEFGYSKLHEPFDAYADPNRESRRRMSQLKYEAYKLEVPVMQLNTLAEFETKLLAWAITHNMRSHPSLPITDEFLSMAAAVEAFENGGADNV